MIFSKLLILATICLLPVSLNRFECSFSYCQHYDSDWWRRHADYCLRCSSGKIYHCARDYDNPEIFKEGCSIAKICSAGEEPRLSFKRSGQQIDEPDVYCELCYDKDYYNSVNKSSSTYSTCPDKKWNDCSEGTHKIECKDDDSKSERYCRCDARKGYAPINDLSNVMCSYKDYECRNYECPKLPNGKPQQRLLNYTCAPYCDEGYDRLREDSDTCEPKPTVQTTLETKSSNYIKPSITTANSVLSVSPVFPVPSETPIACQEDCDDYSVCKNGTCVCIDSCPSDFKPVCGYNSNSDEYKTFPTECDLHKNFCKNKQYHLSHHGKCEKKGQTLPIILAVSISSVVIMPAVIYCFLKSRCGKKCTQKFCPYPNLDMEIEVISPLTGHSAVDGCDIEKGNGHPNDVDVNRQLSNMSTSSAPLCKPEDTSTPSLNGRRPMIVNKTTNIYNGPFVQTKHGTNQISINERSESEMQVKYNAASEEKEPLLPDSDSGNNQETRQRVPVEVKMNDDIDSIDHDVKNKTLDTEKDKQEQKDISEKNEKANEDRINESSKRFDKADGISDINSSNTETLLGTIEAESDCKPVTVALVESKENKLSYEKKLERGMSLSHSSLDIVQDIEDVQHQCRDMDEYKRLTNKVLDKSLKYLVENMDPKLVLWCFTTKEMFESTAIRDIWDHTIQSDRSDMIVKKVRETGEHNFNKFKECLKDTKQFSCLKRVLREQRNVLAEIKPQTGERKRHDSALCCSELDICSSKDNLPVDDNVIEINMDKDTEKSGEGDVQFSQSEEIVGPRRAGPLFVPVSGDSFNEVEQNDQTESKTKYLSALEEECEKCLEEFSTILKPCGDWKTLPRDKKFEMFVEMCEEIKLPELSSESLLQHQLVKDLPECIKYLNTPSGFQAYKSSGRDNSCLYQSLSLLLNGTENLQHSLRLLAALQAVSSFEKYKEYYLGQNNDAVHWKLYFKEHVNDQTYEEIQGLEDAESVIDACLKELIMETVCLRMDSSILHVRFLCEALGVKIHQHFQHNTQYGSTSEVVPLFRALTDENLDEIHIFWVNIQNIEGSQMNHIVPLLKIPDDSS